MQGNRVLLQQALLNLITNSEQALAGRQGGVIRVEVMVDADRALVRVVDSGPGVSEAQRAAIFEPFVTTRERKQSAGLGLFAARHIAELHGGFLELEATQHGASFLFSLPLMS